VTAKKTFPWLVIFIASALCFYSCEEKPCLLEPKTTFTIGFYSAANPEEKLFKPFRLSDFSLRQKNTYFSVAQVSDTFKKKTFFNTLPLSLPENGSDGFWLSMQDSTFKDSVLLKYSDDVKSSGESCGFYFGFRNLTIDSIGGNRIKAARVRYAEGDSTQRIHVEIFW